MKVQIEDLRDRFGGSLEEMRGRIPKSARLRELRERVGGFSAADLLDRVLPRRRRQEPPPILWLAAGFAFGLVLGAGLAYVFDPELGALRRSRLVKEAEGVRVRLDNRVGELRRQAAGDGEAAMTELPGAPAGRASGPRTAKGSS